MRNEPKLTFTYLCIEISIDRYIQYDKWFYEYMTPEGKMRCSLHTDKKYPSIAEAMYGGVRSVNDYFNGDPWKSIGV